MAWIPGQNQRYYNPTTNRVPASIFNNHFRYALEEARTNVFEGVEDAVYHDVKTTWTEIELKPVNVPIVPVTMITSLEKRQKIEAAAEQVKADRKAGRLWPWQKN